MRVAGRAFCRTTVRQRRRCTVDGCGRSRAEPMKEARLESHRGLHTRAARHHFAGARSMKPLKSTLAASLLTLVSAALAATPSSVQKIQVGGNGNVFPKASRRRVTAPSSRARSERVASIARRQAPTKRPPGPRSSRARTASWASTRTRSPARCGRATATWPGPRESKVSRRSCGRSTCRRAASSGAIRCRPAPFATTSSRRTTASRSSPTPMAEESSGSSPGTRRRLG